jgi:hypothetical protein
MSEYKKSLDDEIDWKVIDQLHSATVNFSATSLELKKLFFVLMGIAIPSLIKLAGDKLDLSLFITLYVLITTFWFFDSFTYFYQEKLREKMDSLFNKIKTRNKVEIILTDNLKNEYTIETVRTSKDRVWRSISNISIRFYFVLLILNTVALVLFLNQIIK